MERIDMPVSADDMAISRIEEVAETPYQAELLAEAVKGRFGRAFDNNFSYYGRLGYSYKKPGTSFALWAPTAYRVTLNLYPSETVSFPARTVEMSRTGRGVWRAYVDGDLDSTVYDFSLEFFDGKHTLSPDPYARAAVVNGQKSVVLSPESMAPGGFPSNPRETSLRAARSIPSAACREDTIVEMHIRDFTISETSGVTPSLRGTFLGAAEPGTRTPNGSPTGFDYLKSQGIRYVQILPMYDFGSIDEARQHRRFGSQYNWGYDPVNYNVPEGSYSSDPFDPRARIVEMKKMVNTFQKAGIRVIMDVVYNHVYNADMHPFGLTVPGYFFRTNSDGTMADGTGCGNDVASERAMARKYIVDSVLYWAREYHLDGFRFDLMGNLDIDTMNAVRKSLSSIDPTIIVLGEGWDLNTPLAADRKATQGNARTLEGVSFFNDTLRDAIKGDTFNSHSRGFAAGREGAEKVIASEMLGGYYKPHYFRDASQRVQYVEVHDNYTLFDKLQLSMPQEDIFRLHKRCDLATSMVLLSLGIPEIQLGQEFLRTKDGVGNSYSSPDTINSVDWLRAEKFRSSVEYIRGLISFRRSCPYFRMTDYGEIARHARILKQDEGVVALGFFDSTGKYGSYVLAFNASDECRRIPGIESGAWQIVASGGRVWGSGSAPHIPPAGRYYLNIDNTCIVEPLDTLILRSAFKGVRDKGRK